jgi:hypothetical protein
VPEILEIESRSSSEPGTGVAELRLAVSLQPTKTDAQSEAVKSLRVGTRALSRILKGDAGMQRPRHHGVALWQRSPPC